MLLKILPRSSFKVKLKYLIEMDHSVYRFSSFWEKAKDDGKWLISMKDNKSRGDLEIECVSMFSQSLKHLLNLFISESMPQTRESFPFHSDIQ